jgi:hypothetical protein
MKRLLTSLIVCAAALCMGNSSQQCLLTAYTSGGALASATDNFTRTNANPISNPMSDGTSTWTTASLGAFGVLQIIGNQAAGATGGDCAALVTAPAFTGQHYMEFTVVAANGATYFGPGIRGTSGGNGYVAYVNGSATQIIIAKATAGVFLTLSTYTVTALNPGDIIRLEGTGTSTVTLTLKINGSAQGSPATDSTLPYTGGSPFIYINSTGSKCARAHASDF